MHEPIEQLDQDMIAISYSCHMHPITQLTIPDFMDQDKSSMIDTTCTILYAMLPMALNFFLNSASSFINIYMIGTIFFIQANTMIGSTSARSALEMLLQIYLCTISLSIWVQASLLFVLTFRRKRRLDFCIKRHWESASSFAWL